MNYQNASVIIVDDEETIVEQLEFFLGELGFRVRGFTDSSAASEILKQENFDILMTDLKMPVFSGMDLVKIIKERNLDTRIIIFTGFATTDSAIDAIKYGVYRYIRKPYNLMEVGEVVTDAAKMLYLERENAALNLKIQRMYNYITMLYDVVNILYQVDDLNLAIDMVLDTITEALSTEKVGLLLPAKENGTFVLTHDKGFGKETAGKLRVLLQDTINGQVVDGKTTLLLQPSDRRLLLASGEPFVPYDVENFLLIPIRYHEQILGFFAVVNLQNDDFEIKDKSQLLEILATQFAPVIFAQKLLTTNNNTLRPLAEVVEDIIDQKIDELRRIHASMPVALLRLVPNTRAEKSLPLPHLKEKIQNLIKGTIPEDTEIIWQNFDSIILMKPRANVVDLEILLSLVQQQIEQITTESDNVQMFKAIFSVVAYPFDGRTAAMLINELTHRLMEQYKNLQCE